ncbi:MAG TPA: urea ABC transporter substrate-binding protein [Haliangium sp.]|nr:urea ABC transporter substrate-binding protein [Haliangium sp.]
MHRRDAMAAFAGLGLGLLTGCPWPAGAGKRPIQVGVLHSLSGTMAISERSLVDATLLGLQEINEAGGLLGRRVEPVVVDGRSRASTFATQAESLVAQRVRAIFGCWTSSSRKLVKPVVERGDCLLFYPVAYEGLEGSPSIVYTGAAPNQQLAPAVAWSMEHLGRRCFLVGSDYVYPRAANAIIRDYWTGLGGQIVGQHYLPLGSARVHEVVAEIDAVAPDVIFNSITGDTNVIFFSALRAAGITPDRIPTMSLGLAEEELRALDVRDLAGDYATHSYFQTIDSPENRRFVAAFQGRYGAHRVTSDAIEAAYIGTKLWAQAVTQAGTTEVRAVRQAIGRQSYAAPEGMVYVDPDTQHLWKSVRIGRVRADGQFDVVWSSGKPVRPVPYPLTRSRAAWVSFLDDLYQSWEQQWSTQET